MFTRHVMESCSVLSRGSGSGTSLTPALSGDGRGTSVCPGAAPQLSTQAGTRQTRWQRVWFGRGASDAGRRDTGSSAAVRARRVMVLAASASKAKEETKPAHRLLGSLVGAFVAEVITLPTDVAKTRMQVLPHYKGLVDCVRRTAAEEGPHALWKGLSPALVRQLCYTGLALVIYEPIRNFYSPSGEPSFVERLAAGGTAGAVSISIFNPTEVVKTQMQSASSRTSMLAVARNVWNTRGVLGFWAGLQPNIARTFLVNAAELGTYDQTKHFLMRYVGDTFWAFLGASAVAGFASACISTPADVIKTRLMNQAGGVQVYSGIVDACATTVRTEGVMALYKGFTPIFARKIVWCSAFFVCYEAVMHRLE